MLEDTSESEYVNQRKDNTMTTKRQQTKGQTTIYKTLHIKLKIDQHEPHQKKKTLKLD